MEGMNNTLNAQPRSLSGVRVPGVLAVRNPLAAHDGEIGDREDPGAQWLAEGCCRLHPRLGALATTCHMFGFGATCEPLLVCLHALPLVSMFAHTHTRT